MKTKKHTGQLEKCLIRSTELLPADQEPSRAIEPGEETLDHPTSGLLGGFQVIGGLFQQWVVLERLPIPSMVVRIQTRMRFIAAFV